MRPYYQDAAVTIYHGANEEILPQIDGISGIVSDPPYGINWNADYTRFTGGFKVPRTCHRKVMNDNRVFDPQPFLAFPHVILWGSNCYCSALPLGSWLVWDKRHTNGTAFLADAELAFWNKGHGVYIYAETSQGCIRKEPIFHPTQKPEGLMRWCLEKMPASAIICDPFMGSGTTLRAAKDLGRKAIGIEIEEKYCEIAAKRMAQEVLAL